VSVRILLFILAIYFISASGQESDLCATLRLRPEVESAPLKVNEFILDKLSLNQDERVEITCQIYRSLEGQYSGIAIKESRLGINFHDHMLACVKREALTSDNSRIMFSERMRECLSAFKDGHLRAGLFFERASVTLPIRTVPIGEKIFIGRLEAKFIQFYGKKTQSNPDLSGLEPGSELLEIDDRPVKEVADDLSKYMHYSSDEGRWKAAVEALSNRTYRYPETNFARVKVRARDGRVLQYSLPWMIEGEGMPDSMIVLRNMGIPMLGPADGTTDENGGANAEFLRFPTPQPLFFDDDTIVLLGDDGKIQARLGEIIVSKSDSFCYVALLESTNHVLHRDTGARGELLDWLRPFLKRCESKSLPLVLDLRTNLGGDYQFPAAMASLLMASEQEMPKNFLSLRNSKYTLPGILTFFNSSNPNAPSTMPASVLESIQKGQDFTAPFEGPPIHVDSVVGGFHQPVVALISEWCGSGCEILAGLLKASHRAVLVGTPTEGTGLGGLNFKGAPAGYFSDRFNLFYFQIPTVVFGILPAGRDVSSMTVSETLDASMENRPVTPDIRYDLTVDDLSNGRMGLIEAALQALRAEPSR
jgi:hypothetical protein